MEFWILLIGIVTLVVLFPYIRCLIIRLSGIGKIKKVCKIKGYKLHPTRKLWCLGSKRSLKCDIYIETENDVFSIKLFGMPRKRSVLILKEKKEYIIRNYIVVFSYSPGVREPFDSKPKQMPAYDFRYKFKNEWEAKALHNVLLVTPAPMEFIRRPKNGGDVPIGSGDMVDGTQIYCSSFLIDYLKKL